MRELSARLAGEGWIDPWVDDKKLLLGQDWRTKIEEAVETSDVVIVVLSSNSVTKEGFVQKELRYAREIAFEKPDETVFLIPLRLDDCSVPRGLRFYQRGDYFGEKKEETYKALLESLKLRYEQKLKLEEEEHAQKKKAEQERIALEEKVRQDAEERARIKKEEKVRRDAELAAQEKEKREAVEKAKRERVERQAAQKALLKQAFSKSFTAFKTNLPKINPPLRVAGFAGIALALIWIVSWGFPKLISLVPAAKASLTLTSRPVSTITFTPSHLSPTKTLTPIPIGITDAKGVSMVLVPAGEFTMGSESDNNDEKPVHAVYLDAFYMDIYEVTNVAYQACVNADVCTLPQQTRSYTRSNYYGNPDFDDYPVIYIDWSQAKKYCEWRNGNLPTEAQWEKAARGDDERTYPWGERIDSNLANYNSNVGDTTKVGSFESGKSPYGIYDLAGNVWEWVADWYSETYYQNSLFKNPLGPDVGQYRVLRGGSWGNLENFLHVSFRGGSDPANTNNAYGFRCVRSP